MAQKDPASDHAFTLCATLGFRFFPRMRDLPKHSGYGSAVMVGIEGGAGGGGDNGEALNSAGVRGLAAVPQASKADRRVVLGHEAPLGFLTLLTGSFTSALSRDLAAALLEGVAKW